MPRNGEKNDIPTTRGVTSEYDILSKKKAKNIKSMEEVWFEWILP